MQSRAHTAALFLILGSLVAFTARQQALILPQPPAEIIASHTAIVLQLPDTGGIAINHQPIALTGQCILPILCLSAGAGFAG